MIYTLTLNPAVDKTILVDQISPNQASIVQDSMSQAAGKGINVSRVLDKLDVNSTIVTLLGGDRGAYIRTSLDTLGLEYIDYAIQGNTRENTKIVPNLGRVVELNEKGPMVLESDLEPLMNDLMTKVKPSDIVVITGSLPQGLPNTTYQSIVSMLHQQNVITLLDASKEALQEGLRAIPKIIKPNIHELEDYFQTTISSKEEALYYGKQLVQTGIEHVLISLGSEGSLYLTTKNAWYAHPLAIDVKNTVGAGDSFVAGFLYGYINSYDPEHCLLEAATVSTAAVLSEGTGLSTIEALDNIRKQIVIEAL